MDGRPNRRNKAEFSNSLSGVLTGPLSMLQSKTVFSSVIIINSAIITITRARVKPTVVGRHCFSFFKFFFFSLKANLSIHTEKSDVKYLVAGLETADYHENKIHRKIRDCTFLSSLQFYFVGMFSVN